MKIIHKITLAFITMLLKDLFEEDRNIFITIIVHNINITIIHSPELEMFQKDTSQD